MTGDSVVAASPNVFARGDLAALIDAETSCVVVQSPDFFGNVRDLSALAAICEARGALLIAVFTEAVSLGLVKPPGAMGADIVVGEGQSIGNGLNFGGPYVGLLAAKAKYLRQMPGRLCGETIDAEGASRLRSDVVNARTTYQARQGDIQHLHQLRSLLSRLQHSPHFAGRGGGCGGSRESITPMPLISPIGSAQ